MQNFTQQELENEVWKDIPEYEGIYQVSDLGRVKSLNREVFRKGKVTIKERILKPCVNKRGYYCVGLCKNGKGITIRVHQLVAMAFLNHVPCGHLIEVNHKDEFKTNNRLTNLEILTHEEHLNFTHRNATSKYKGVSFNKQTQKWKATITINGQRKHLGLFPTELKAHKVVLKAEEMAKNGDFSFMKTREKTSQYKGVSFNKLTNKWEAYIKINGQKKHLGKFTTELQAHEAYQKAIKQQKNIKSLRQLAKSLLFL